MSVSAIGYVVEYNYIRNQNLMGNDEKIFL